MCSVMVCHKSFVTLYKISDMTIEYIAGFFDGEGCINISGNTIRLSISQTNEEVLKEIMNFFGFGYVSHLKKRQKHWKEAWCYYISNNKQALEALRLLEPFLIVKKNKSREAIKILEVYFKKEEVRLAKIQLALDLVRSGKTYREVEKEVGISRQTICVHINK